VHLYENITIFDPGRTDEEINSAVEKTLELITGDGGEILKADHWGRRKMAYELNKHDKGYYVLILFRAQGQTLGKLETAYKVNESIIKYMTVKLGKKHAEGALKALDDAARAEAAPAPEAEPEAAAAPAAEATPAPEAEPAAETAPAAEKPAEG